ncbi:MAG: hypothetical protein V1926_03015 [Candidatus Peregrinibacteria bacterium]
MQRTSLRQGYGRQACANSWCGQSFEITQNDLDFYEKISPLFPSTSLGADNGKKELIPPPLHCPGCRQQRRLVWRNERTLYRRASDLTNTPIVASYPPNTPFPVYETDEWWSDAFDASAFGIAYDSSSPFLSQFQGLLLRVPRISLSNSHNENCDYVTYTNYSRDCYLIYGVHSSEKCCYCWRVHDCLSCFDCAQLYRCQFCFDCTDCDDCYQIFSCLDCQNCNTSSSLRHCRSCRNCMYCTNVANKEHCIFNEQYSPAQYEQQTRYWYSHPKEALDRFAQLLISTPQKSSHNIQCEDCTGDYLIRCKDCHDTYSAKECRDCTRLYLGEHTTDCHDCDITGWPAEMCYEGTSTCVDAHQNIFSSLCWSCSDIAYCDSCFHSRNLFGCVGFKKNEYCILNRQYTKEEYEQLVPQIIAKMRTDGEWGEFFPVTLSPFAYNETVAHENFPLTKEEVLRRGWQWRDQKDEMPKVDRIMPAVKLPDSIDEIPDAVLNWAIECETTKRPFKIIKQELEFYRQMHLPVPHFHPDERHRRRMALRNPRKLWNRECAKCHKPIATSYAPDRPEIVYCESCYLQEVY